MASATKKRVTDRSGQIDFVWGHICSLSSIDQERNNISLFNVIDQLTIPAEAFGMYTSNNKPVLIQIEHELIFLLRRAIDPAILGGETIPVDLKVSLLDPRGTALIENLLSFNFPPARRFRQRIKFPGFFITEPGDYVYKVEMREHDHVSFNKSCQIPVDVRSKAA
jgi:hypothetical protein